MRDVATIRGPHFQFRQREDKITFTRGQLYRCDAHVATSDDVLRLNRHHVRRQAGVGQIRHEALVVTAPEELDPLAEFRVVTDFDLKADRKPKARPDTVEVIVAGREHDAGRLDALPQVHLHPFHHLGLL